MEGSNHSIEDFDDYESEPSGSSSSIEDAKGVSGGSALDKNEEVEDNFSAGALPASDAVGGDDRSPEFKLRQYLIDDVADYDVVLIHGIRDSYKTVWIHENTCNWVKSHMLHDKKANLLEFRYDISDTAPMYSEGIETEATRLLDELMEISKNRRIRPLIFMTRDLGGIIAQIAVLMASRQASPYDNIARLTNLMIFYNCPQRSSSLLEVHDTMIKLLNITGYPGLTALSTKAKRLAEQVTMVNHDSIDAMLWLHIPIVNIISLPTSKESDSCASSQDGVTRCDISPYYLSKNSAMVQQPLERPYFTNLTHLELAQYKNEVPAITSIIKAIEEYFPKSSCLYYYTHGIAGTPTWRYILSECPPIRSPLIQNILEEPTDDEFWSWFTEQKEYQFWFDQQDVGTQILHVYGSSLVDVWSDKIYHGLDMSRSWQDTTVHFRFDRNDIRFDNVHGMISYLVTQLYRRLVFIGQVNPADTFASFLDNSRGCSTADLFQWLLILHHNYHAAPIIYMISCIDECKDDIITYLHRIQDFGQHTEQGLRILVTSTTKDLPMGGLEGYPSINSDRFVADQQHSPNRQRRQNRRLIEELSALDSETRTLVNQMIDSCGSDSQLSGTLLAWLISVQRSHGLGLKVINILKNLSTSPSLESTYAAIRASLPGSLQEIEKEVYIIVKTALHPLSIDQIAWILILDDSGQYLADTVKRQQDITVKIRQLLPGLYELKHGEVHLCHDYWRSRDCDATQDEASRHTMMAKRCLGYLSIPQIQEDIASLRNVDSDKLYPVYFGNNLTAYSVKFLSHHYKLAGKERPKQELFEFFTNEKTRMTWYNVHIRLTSYVRRPLYSQSLPGLPVVAQTGLTDLTAMFIETEKNEENFQLDGGIALIEAARYGLKEVVDQLLEAVDAKAEVLKDAISSAASYGSVEPLFTLVRHCAAIKDFEWPDDILHRTSWLGLTSVVEKLLEAGVTPNLAKELENYRGYLPFQLCMPGRNQDTAKLLVQTGRADVNAKYSVEKSALVTAARYSNLDILPLVFQRDEAENSDDLHTALFYACYASAFTAARELLKKIPPTDWESASEKRMMPLTMTASYGYFKCVEALVTHGVNANLSNGETLPLLSAVQSRRLKVARLLLAHGANPDITTKQFKLPLLAAVDNDDVAMVKLLVEMGADVEIEDQTDVTMKTALSSAASFPSKDMLDYLLHAGANVNHIAAGSRSPLFAAAWHGRADNVKMLLEHGADINTAVSNPVNWAPINAAYDNTPLLKVLIEGGADINHLSRDGAVLFQAARWGFEATVELLLEYRKDLDLDKELIDEEDGEYSGMSPLCVACRYNRVGIMRLLLEAGADAQHQTRHGQFPLELCMEFAPQELPDQALHQLLEYHPRINLSQRDNDGNTALHKINASTPLANVKLLANAGADLSSVNNKGYTALMIALEVGNVEVSRYLFGKTAGPLDTESAGSGLLHRAVIGPNLELIKMIIEAGADVNEADPRTGETPLYTHLTIESPSILVVRYLVETCKANINLASGDLKYPIIQACKNADLEIIRCLVEAGADVNIKDHVGRSPIHLFFYGGYNDIDILVSHGADLDARDKLGRTAVHYAAAIGDEKDVEELLKLSNIDVNARDDDGWTPIMWASLQRKTWNLDYVADVLLARGADIWVRGKVEDEEWSPLKLARFHGGYGSWVLEKLEPADKSKPRFPEEEDYQEYWDEEFHQSQRGFEWSEYTCDSCFCRCFGIRWRCKEEHAGGFDLCFRCYPHRNIIHPGHEHFNPLGERFKPEGENTEPSEGHVSEDEVSSEGSQSE